jgi:hypothetical protein
VLENEEGKEIAQKNTRFIQKLLQFDIVIIAGQAKSHCVAWTIDDLLRDILLRNKKLAKRIYLLEDCTSPSSCRVMDYTDQADAAFGDLQKRVCALFAQPIPSEVGGISPKSRGKKSKERSRHQVLLSVTFSDSL